MSVWSSQTIAILPCLDEARTIATLVRELVRQVATVLVVDDGSRDTTGIEARAAGAEVLRHPLPRGKGCALATGWEAATRRGAEWVLLLDGDGQHAPEDAPLFFAAAGLGPQPGAVRLVIGNRMAEPHSMPWLRRNTNLWLSRRLTALAGVPLPDSQCGYRFAHLPSLLACNLRTGRFEIESEMAVAFARAGHRISSVPIAARYGLECSKINPWRDTVRWWRWYRAAVKRLGPAPTPARLGAPAVVS